MMVKSMLWVENVFSTNRKIEYLDETVEIYDIHRDTLLTDPVNPHQAASAAAFVYDDKLIVMGGSTYRVENGCKNIQIRYTCLI